MHGSVVAHEIYLFDSETSLRILIAESDPALRRSMRDVLRGEGHEVVEAADGAELLEALAAALVDSRVSPADVIVCRDRLPGMPGLSVLAGLRARSSPAAFVLLTEEPAVKCRARALGAVTLEPPFDDGDLLSAVHQSAQRNPSNDNGRRIPPAAARG